MVFKWINNKLGAGKARFDSSAPVVWTKDKVDRTRSTIGSESAEADKFRSKGALTTMLILALLINYILEGFIPAFRFSGFELSFFIGTIVYGDWVGIYN